MQIWTAKIKGPAIVVAISGLEMREDEICLWVKECRHAVNADMSRCVRTAFVYQAPQRRLAISYPI